MKSGTKLLPASVLMVASLLTWWAQAGAHGLAGRLQTAPRQGTPARPGQRPAPTPRTGSQPGDTGRYRSSLRPRVRAQDRPGSPFGPQRRRSPLVLPLPSNVKLKVTPDDSLRTVDVQEKVGTDIDYRDPSQLSFEEYAKFQERQAISDYFREKARGGVVGAPAAPGTPQAQRLIPKIYLGPIANRIFGGSYVDIRPAGSLTVRAGWRQNTNANPALTLRQQRVGDFIFEQNMNVNLTGQIGTRLKLVFNYDTKASFDFDNQMKFDFVGEETDIVRKVDLGNVSLPLNNSLVQGGQNLFGAKVALQFGRLGVTAVGATVRGTADEVRIQNGSQSRQYELKASQYERDRHFFLTQFFRDRYDQALRNLPTVQSGVEIRNLEVYVTNDNRTTENLRNVVALQDLAEPVRLYRSALRQGSPTERTPAANGANSLLTSILAVPNSRDNLQVEGVLGSLGGGLAKNIDYERVRARKLDPREYTFNAQLGYLSLNTGLLPDQVLGVSFQYLYNGQTYSVGEIQTDYAQVRQDQVIFLKMLKATNPGVGLADPAQNPLNLNLATRNLPTWDLMMKNIYPLNASQLSRDNFQLQLIYKDDVTGVDLISLKEGARIQNVPLIQVLGLDRVNPNNDRNADGNFDFFPGITIDPELGKIIFPNVQPFGSYLRGQFNPEETALIDKYVYQELYDQTQSDAQQVQVKDKFFLRGRYQGGGGTDEINLPGIGIAQGSVRVRSGSTLLTEGVDYQVFYDQAKVKILNPSYLNSANELRVEFEKNALVQVQPRRLLGARFDYRVSEDASLGGTVLSLLENQAPGINRVNVGDEPGNNTIIGLDGSFRKESRVITKYLDKLPFLSTKEPSSIAFTGEFAKLIAGQSKLGRGENGVSYIDDFENARTPYTLGGLAAVPAWRLAATPAAISTAAGITNGDRRARLAWYTVDQSYYNKGPDVPANIGAGDLKNHYIRGIQRNEIFPNKDLGSTGNGYEYSFDLAYFPRERGPYNYTAGVSGDGKFLTDQPGQNYGGISRAITFDTDFDNANIEYLEFWLMDPFLKRTNPGTNLANITDQDGNDQPNLTGGELHLNLGNVSEDVLKDGNQHEFENGLPTTNDPTDVANNTTPTPFGLVTTQQFLTDAFNAAPGARARQDIGLDGLDDAGEQGRAGQPNSYPAIYGSVPDPSNDDFRHHLDPAYNDNDTKILGRYKRYNGYQGNSEENSQRSSTSYPDKEDLNRDNVVQDVERYYDYRLDLRPGQLEVGRNYIIDKVTNKNTQTSGDEVTWYQFRIPVREYSGIVGNDNRDFGFKSIRFMRMYMTGWQEPVVLRLVQPQFVANQWRRFLQKISGGSSLTTNVTDADAFSISTVSVEENGLSQNDLIPYVAPPGIQRDREYGSSSTSRLQNEQSLRLSVTNLRDDYAKAAYKNITINLLRYKRLKMFLHGESDDPNTSSGDIQAFVRIGTDYTQNYYQYSLPLQLTPRGQRGQRDVWPEANEIDIRFQDFIDLKAERNRLGLPFNIAYPKELKDADGKVKAIISIVGNPDFSAVQGCMIGMLNPAGGDRREKSATLWADEFRVFDFEQQDGYAATARFNAKLADVANIIATGSFTSVGFGGLQDKAQQRSLDDIFRGDVNVTVAAEKFLPPQFNLRVPVLLQVGHESRSPQYDPLDPDTKLNQSLQKFRNDNGDVDEAARAAYRNEVIDQTTSKSISVLNVRKERNPDSKALPKPWDIENVAVSYSLTERLHTDIRTDRDFTRSYTGALAYVYQTTPKNYTPLAGIKALDNPYLKIFQQVNFTPLPSRFSFRADIDRRYNERLLQRVLNPGEVPSTAGINYVVQKVFFFNRIYDLKWDITKALILDYTATNRGVVDEGQGRTIGDDPLAQANRDQIMSNLRRGGRTTNFNQQIAATYRLPLDQFPLTDWISADARYVATYSWQAASTALVDPNAVAGQDSTLKLGNTIQNNAELQANGRIDLVKLYNKVRFLNIINNAPPPPPRPRPAPRNPDGTRPTPPPAPNAAPTDTTSAGLRIVKAVLRSLMTARSLNFTYTRSNGTLLPGYLPKTHLFGFNNGFTAPGVGFILGEQEDLNDLFTRANGHGWYTDRSDLLNTPLSSLYTDNLTLRTTLEPIRDFNIQLDARKQQVRNREVFYRRRFNEQTSEIYRTGPDSLVLPQASNALGSGSFSISTITIRTLFGDLGANGETSKAFDRFVSNRAIVRERLQAGNPSSAGQYSFNSSEVLIQSFRDAYRGKTSDGYKAERKANPFINIPLPNWNVQYNGLSQVPLFQNIFSSFTLNHAYTSLYNVGAYSTSTNYNEQPAFSDRANSSGLYIPYYIVSQVSIIEGLTPLIGINFQTLNQITGRAEYRTSRGLLLNTTNAQITEQHTTELIVGAGYATNRLKLPFRVGGEQRVLTNTLTARLDLSLRDNTTIQRSILDVVDSGSATPDNPISAGRGISQITNGALQVQLRPTIDYLLNTRLNLQFYFTQNITTPRVSNAFRNATTEGGIQLRYSLQ